MAPRSPLADPDPAPAAHSSRAAAGTASNGSMMSGAPDSPNAVIPHSPQDAGRDGIGPGAPALAGPLLPPSPLSICPMAASTVQDRPGQSRAAEAWNSCR